MGGHAARDEGQNVAGQKQRIESYLAGEVDFDGLDANVLRTSSHFERRVYYFGERLKGNRVDYGRVEK